jgi:hypothetical protein
LIQLILLVVEVVVVHLLKAQQAAMVDSRPQVKVPNNHVLLSVVRVILCLPMPVAATMMRVGIIDLAIAVVHRLQR